MEYLFNFESDFNGEFNNFDNDYYSNLFGKKKPKFIQKLEQRKPAFLKKLEQKGLARLKKLDEIRRSHWRNIDKGLARFDQRIGLSKGATAARKSIENLFKKIGEEAAKKMSKKYGGAKGLNRAINLFNASPQGQKVQKKVQQMGTSLVRNFFRNLAITLYGVKIPIGPTITLWANTKDGRRTLGKIPNHLGGLDIRKTFIFEGLDPDTAIKMAAAEFALGFVPGGSLFKSGVKTTGKFAMRKGLKWEDTRDK